MFCVIRVRIYKGEKNNMILKGWRDLPWEAYTELCNSIKIYRIIDNTSIKDGLRQLCIL